MGGGAHRHGPWPRRLAPSRGGATVRSEGSKGFGGGLFTKIPEILAKKNSEIIQEPSRTFLSHSEEDYLRRERKIIYEDSGDSYQ